MLKSSNARKYAEEFVSGAYVVSAGHFLLAGLPTALKSGAALSDRCFAVRPNIGGEAGRGVRLRFYSDGAENATASYRIYAMNGVVNTPNGQPVEFVLNLLGSGTLTIGATTGVDGAIVDDAYRWVDTATWTKEAAATAMFDAMNAPDAQAYSPAGDAIAFLQIPDLAGAPWLVIDIDGATESWGAVIEAIT